jgi:DNA replication licensing factor MCM4
LRDLDPTDIDKLVSIKGFVIRLTNPIPELKTGFFECNRCAQSQTVPVENGRLNEPGKCQQCNVGMYQMVYSRSEFYDKQIIKLQETPDSVPDGQTPHTVSLVAYDELVDCVKPGDRIVVTGIFKAMAVRANPKQRITRSIFKTYIDVLHVQSSDKNRKIGGSLEETQIEGQLSEQLNNVTAEMEQKFRQIAADPNVFDRLSHSVAPSIFGHNDAKKAVLLQLFGGSTKEFKKSESTKSRGNIHVLLCGDPATSKSQILMYVHRLSPRGIYTSGKGSSAVGLTASVSRDPESKQLVLER